MKDCLVFSLNNECTMFDSTIPSSSSSSTSTTRRPLNRITTSTTASPSPEDSYVYEDREESEEPENTSSSTPSTASLTITTSAVPTPSTAVSPRRSRDSQAGQNIVAALREANFCDNSELLKQNTRYFETILGAIEDLQATSQTSTSTSTPEVSRLTTPAPRDQPEETPPAPRDQPEEEGSGDSATGRDSLVEDPEEFKARNTREVAAAANFTEHAIHRATTRMLAKLVVFLNHTSRKTREELMQVPVLWIRPLVEKLENEFKEALENHFKSLTESFKWRDERLQRSIDLIYTRAARDTDAPRICLWEGGQLISTVTEWFNKTVSTTATEMAEKLMENLKAETLDILKNERRWLVQIAIFSH